MRTFIGIDLSNTWRDTAREIRNRVETLAPGWAEEKWVPAANLHMTLAFFGDLDREAEETLVSDLASALSGQTAFDLALEHPCLAVPDAKRASMLWSTFSDPEGRGASLAEAAWDVGALYGVVPSGKAFHPHVTLCRARRPRRFGSGPEIRAGLTRDGAQFAGSMSVRAVTVFSSTLTQAGARYRTLGEITLD